MADHISEQESRIASYLTRVELLLLLLLTGFGFRLSFLLASVYHPDEFISMLAAKMVAQRGLPILPSGLFYDHGLLYSFLAGAFVALLGFTEQVARWPVLVVGVFTIAAYYVTARRLFDSHLTGLLAAALVTFDILSIKWGVWARMYALAHLFILLSLAWLLTGTLKYPGRRDRFLFFFFLTAALFSHLLTFFILPPLAVLLFIFTLAYRREWLRHPRLWLEAIIFLAVLAIALAVAGMGQAGSTVSLQDPNINVPAPFGLEFLRGFFLPGLEWFRFRRFVKFYLEPSYRLLLLAVVLSLLVTLYRLRRRTVTFADVTFLFLALYVPLVIFEMGVLLTADWQKRIYMFILTFPAFLLLIAESLARLLRWLARLASKSGWVMLQHRHLNAIMPWVGVVLIAVMWAPEGWDTAHAQTTGSYKTAFSFLEEHWQAGDKLMTDHPAAAYLYHEQTDYYANQVTAKVLEKDGSETLLVDRYTGSLLIDTVEKFNAALATGARIWFVVGTDHLNKYYDSYFHPQIFAQMDLVRRFGEIYIFVSRPAPTPVPAEPMAGLDANFGDFIRLEGYSLDLTTTVPGETTLLGLFWRPVGSLPSNFPKVFVQLRDSRGQTISQADHFIFEGVLPSNRWDRVREEGEWLRDTADLVIPSLPPQDGPYRIYIGLYNPDTFERVPLLNDASGENAVIIDLSDLPGRQSVLK